MILTGTTTAPRLGAVLLHGRGGSAADILGLADAVGTDDMRFAAPEADGNSWWPTSFLAPAGDIAPWLARGVDAVEEAVAALEAEGLERSRIAVLGFSQGACLALEYAARRGGLQSVVALSGGLIGTGDARTGPRDDLYGYGEKLFNYDTDLTGTAAYLGCHEADPHIPKARVTHSATVLEDLGATVTLDLLPGAGHGILPREITAVRALWGT